MKGRKPLPTSLKKLNSRYGNNTDSGGRPLNADEPKASALDTRCPPGLSDEAKRMWRKLVATLGPLNVTTQMDEQGLILLVSTWSRWQEAEEILKRDGMIQTDHNGVLRQHPALRVANEASKQLLKLLTEFGMTPSSRSRIHATPQEEQDPGEDLFNKLKVG